MGEQQVVCGGLKARPNRSSALHLDVNASAKTTNRINLRVNDISRRLAQDIPEVLVDMLEIATYVYCADQFTAAAPVR